MFPMFGYNPASSFARIQTDSRYLRFHGTFQVILAVIFFYFGSGNLPFQINLGIASLMAGIGFHNLWRHVSVQDRLKSLNKKEKFTVKMDWIVSHSKNPKLLFLGKGFSWNTKCTQLYDQLVNLPNFDDIIEPEPKSGGKVFMHNLGREEETPKFFELPVHTVITGSTGCGKTRLIELIAAQIIVKQSSALIIVDPKGDRDLLNIIYNLAVRSGRQDSFKFFSLLHPNHSETFNVLEDCSDGNEVAARIVSILAETGGGQATTDPFLMFCSQVIKATAQLMRVLNETVTFSALYYYVVLDEGSKMLDSKAKEQLSRCRSEKERRNLQEAHQEFNSRIIEHSREHMDKMTALLYPALSMLGTGEIGALLSPETGTMSTEAIIENNHIAYIYLGSMANNQLSSMVGKMFVQNIVGRIGKAYADTIQLKDFWLMVDEFYPIVFPGYITMLAQARAAGMRMILGMQTSADVAAALGEVGMQQVYGNVSNMICMCIKEKNLAEIVADQGETSVLTSVTTRNISAGMHTFDHLYRSGSSVRVTPEKAPRIKPEQLSALPAGEFFLLTQGYFPIKMVAPMLDNPIPEGQTYFEMLEPRRPLRMGPDTRYGRDEDYYSQSLLAMHDPDIDEDELPLEGQ